MKKLRFAVLGCGFWSRFQIAGWKELEGVELTALYNRTVSKAERLASEFNVPRVYDSAEKLFEQEKIDFVDIITDVYTHEHFVKMAASQNIPVICQKPMAPSYEDAKNMVDVCNRAGVLFMVHENWRWQEPIRQVKKKIDLKIIGKPFRARISYCNDFPVFEMQPFLADLEQFILTDIGSHILDTARFLFGEVESIYCQIATINKNIKGEDVASVSCKMKNGIHCNIELSYASRLEHTRFPETHILVEGENGSIELASDFWLRVTTSEGTYPQRVKPQQYQWMDVKYAAVPGSIVNTNKDFLAAVKGEKRPEITGEDNLKTMKLVFAAYESAKNNSTIRI